MKNWKEIVENLNNGIISKKIYEAINNYKSNLNKYNKADNYYFAKKETLKKSRILEGVPDNKIIAPFARYITVLNVGYFMSNEVNYNVNDEIEITPIIDSYRKNTILKVDQANANKCSKYGKSYELTYINENTEIKTKSISPKNAFLIRSDDLDEKPVIGVYFSDKDIYLYTNLKNIHIAKKEDNNTNYEIINIEDNYFEEIPLIEILNNEESIGDFESVMSLIDAYNLVVSNDIDNIEDFIDSILLLYGASITSEQIKLLRETRGLNLGKEDKAEYLTKVLDEIGISQVLERLRKDIHKFSFTPDMSDENFAGNSSGVALAYKILPFELLAKTKESFYEEALKKRFKLYNKFFQKFNAMSEIDVDELDIKFTRGLPKNDLEMAQIISILQGHVTNKTLIAGLSFVKDANEEDELVKEEQQKENNQKKEMFKNAGNFDEENENNKEDKE